MMLSSHYSFLIAGLFAATSVFAAPYPVTYDILEPSSGKIHPRDPPIDRYSPKFVPPSLEEEHIKVYKSLQEIAPAEKDKVHLVVFTDTAVDYDDFSAEGAFSELAHLGFFEVEGVFANLGPNVKKRSALNRWGLNEFGLKKTPVAVGTIGEPSPKPDGKSLHVEQPYEFGGVEDEIKPFMNEDFDTGPVLLRKIIAKAKKGNFKLTILSISSLMDLGQFVTGSEEPTTQEGTQETMQKGTQETTQETTHGTTSKKYSKDGEDLAEVLQNVVLQGGYKITEGKLTPDFSAQNNRWSEKDSIIFHEYLQAKDIPTTVYTKDAAYDTADHMEDGLLEKLAKTNVGPAKYLQGAQIPQDLVFYKKACHSDDEDEAKLRQAIFMDASWFLMKRSTWCLKHPGVCDEDALSKDWFGKLKYPKPQQPLSAYPKDDELMDLRPYLTKLTLYDVIAAIGAIGDKPMMKLGYLKPNFEGNGQHEIHKIAGNQIPAKMKPVMKDGKPVMNKFKKPKMEIETPAVPNFDGKKIAQAIEALMTGAMHRHPKAVLPH